MEDKPKGVAIGQAQWQAAYEAHALAVGEVAFHWNLLHERLGELFGIVAGTSQDVGMAIWYSLKSDLAQREILLAALRASQIDEDRWRARPKATTHIKWVADYVSNTLAARRNDAMHAPCEAGIGVYERSDGKMVTRFEVGPAFYQGNPRAQNLKQKDLIAEFEWYAETAQTLKRFCDAMLNALKSDAAWPDKPPLPQIRRSKTLGR